MTHAEGPTGSLLTSAEIAAWKPAAIDTDGETPMARARERMRDAGQWAPWQMLGRRAT